MLRSRVLTAVLLAPPVVAGVWWLPTAAVAAVAALVFMLALWEWARLVPIHSPAARAAYLVAGLALMAAAWFAGSGRWLASAAWAGVIGWAVVALLLVRVESGRGGAWHAAAKAAIGLLGVVLAWVLLTALHGSAQGAAWFLLFLALVWAADVSAYFAGRRYGRSRLAPVISPGKTWAGAWGAVAGSALVMLAGGVVLGMEPTRLAALVALGVLSAAFSIVGDLFESLVKRQAGAKDSSTLLPGHGGLFDRLDSLFAAAPVYSLGVNWVSA